MQLLCRCLSLPIILAPPYLPGLSDRGTLVYQLTVYAAPAVLTLFSNAGSYGSWAVMPTGRTYLLRRGATES